MGIVSVKDALDLAFLAHLLKFQCRFRCGLTFLLELRTLLALLRFIGLLLGLEACTYDELRVWNNLGHFF